MEFLYPAYLWTLFLVLIPVIIHLFNFRVYKTVYFSNVRYLKIVRKDSKKRKTLKNLLILLSRILAVCTLVLAFSHPYLPLNDTTDMPVGDVAGIYIDNSFSMEAGSEDGKLFELARQKAIEIADAYKENTRFLLITNDTRYSDLRFMDSETLRTGISKISVSSSGGRISDIIKIFCEFVKTGSEHTRNTLFLLSDFQKHSCDFSNIVPDSSSILNAVPFPAPVSANLLIDSAWFELPGRRKGQTELLNVSVTNMSDREYFNMPVHFYENDSLKAMGNLNIGKNENKILPLNIHYGSSGLKNAYVELTDYPITYDNKLYMGYNVIGKIKVLGIIGKDADDKYLKALFSNDELIEFVRTDENSVRFGDFNKYHTIFLLHPERISSGLTVSLRRFIDNGGSLAFIPRRNGNVKMYNSFLSGMNSALIENADSSGIRISNISKEHPLFEDVFPESLKDADLPEIFYYYRFVNSRNVNEYDIIKFPDGGRFLSLKSYNKGKFYVFSSPFTEKSGEFVKHPLFIPSVYNIALQSIPSGNLYNTIGTDPFIETTLAEDSRENRILYLKNLTENSRKIPVLNHLPGNRIRMETRDISKAGNYLLSSSDEDFLALAFNYNRKESLNDYCSPSEIEEGFSDSGIKNYFVVRNPHQNFYDLIEELRHGKELWRIFLFISLLFIIAEILIIRFVR